jgi:hypothetical protein
MIDIHITAKIIPIGTPVKGDPWYVTFGLGTPAGGMYSEVIIPEELDVPREFRELVVRHAIMETYGTNWAFTYPPDLPPGESIRRERIVVTSYQRY